MQQVKPTSTIASTGTSNGLNGDSSALSVDRAIGELRRGRCVAITDAGVTLTFAAVETMASSTLSRLIAASAETHLVLTAERARAGGLVPGAAQPQALKLEESTALESLRALAGMPGAEKGHPAGDRFTPWLADEELVLAAFGLAKAARLIPALVAYPGADSGDDTVHRVALTALLEHASSARTGIQLISEARVPLAGSERSRIALYRDEHGGSEHVAVIIGEPDFAQSVPVRLHSACLTGDLLGSLRCDCGEQLATAVVQIAELGGGVLLYLDQEGRSIGLANKLRAYQIQDTGVDTFDADTRLGFHADERSYDVAAAMLNRLGISQVRLLTNNPEKIEALREHGIDVVARLPLVIEPNAHNRGYLETKRERFGHLGDQSDADAAQDKS